jgi:aspartyl-tRNA(Asn)/glutamyl-tRNA(Gln) amidotransferase subunit A
MPIDSELAAGGDLGEAIRARQVSCRQVVEAVLTRAEEHNATTGAYITITAEAARRRASALDELLASGTYLGPLHGICVSLKDNIATAGLRTTAGSPLLEDWVPDTDAAVVVSLERAGAIVIGKAHLNEFAFGGQHPRFGTTRNPWDDSVTCGGSSNGSAVGVATGLAHLAIATDTAGSARQPAAFAGVVGFKPTIDAVPTGGIIPVSSTLDHVGIIARSADDAAAAFSAIRTPQQSPDSTALEEVRRELTCAPLDSMSAGDIVAPVVSEAVDRALGEVHTLGIRVRRPVALPQLEAALAAMAVITRTEAAMYHEPLIAARSAEYNPALRARLRVGQLLPATAYARALKVRAQLRRVVDGMLDEVDLLVTPTVPFPPPPTSQRTIKTATGTLSMSTASCWLLALFNLTGHPAIALPCGVTDEGLPLSMQFVGRRHADEVVLEAARRYQRATEWHTATPPIPG